VDKITKWGYFILYTEKILAENIARIYVKEVFLRHRLLDTRTVFKILYQLHIKQLGITIANYTIYI